MRAHPVLECAAVVRSAAAAVADLDAVFLSAGEKQTALLELTAAIGGLEELRLRVLAAAQAAGDVAAGDGSRDAAAWLAHHARLDPGRARHLTRLATALDTRWPQVAAGLRAGTVDLAQVEVIVAALDALPEHVEALVRQTAQERLVAEAASFAPRQLRILGRRILDIVAPELAEDHERRQLQDEEAHAGRVTFLRTRRRGDGTTEIHARLADAVVDRLLTYLHAYTSPRQPTQPHAQQQAQPQAPSTAPDAPDASGAPGTGTGAGTGAGDRRPHDQRMGHALGAFLETVDPARLPLHGGDATTVVVTIDHDTLTDALGAAGIALIGDTPITAAHARRLACTAHIIPAVLSGTSQLLDLGRTRRLFSPPQRKALQLRHPHCAAHGCDIPAPWCEAHHAGDPWSHGGHTDLEDGALLCSHHHHLAHDPRYHTTRHPDGTIRFTRRQ